MSPSYSKLYWGVGLQDIVVGLKIINLIIVSSTTDHLILKMSAQATGSLDVLIFSTQLQPFLA